MKKKRKIFGSYLFLRQDFQNLASCQVVSGFEKYNPIVQISLNALDAKSLALILDMVYFLLGRYSTLVLGKQRSLVVKRRRHFLVKKKVTEKFINFSIIPYNYPNRVSFFEFVWWLRNFTDYMGLYKMKDYMRMLKVRNKNFTKKLYFKCLYADKFREFFFFLNFNKKKPGGY